MSLCVFKESGGARNQMETKLWLILSVNSRLLLHAHPHSLCYCKRGLISYCTNIHLTLVLFLYIFSPCCVKLCDIDNCSFRVYHMKLNLLSLLLLLVSCVDWKNVLLAILIVSHVGCIIYESFQNLLSLGLLLLAISSIFDKLI